MEKRQARAGRVWPDNFLMVQGGDVMVCRRMGGHFYRIPVVLACLNNLVGLIRMLRIL